MKTQISLEDGGNLSVIARGNGFYYAVRRFVGDALDAHRRRAVARHTAKELAHLPDYLKQDIGWTPRSNHEER